MICGIEIYKVNTTKVGIGVERMQINFLEHFKLTDDYLSFPHV